MPRALIKLAKKLKPRNPLARSPLLGKGGAHGKTTAAKRRQETVLLKKRLRTPLDDQ